MLVDRDPQHKGQRYKYTIKSSHQKTIDECLETDLQMVSYLVYKQQGQIRDSPGVSSPFSLGGIQNDSQLFEEGKVPVPQQGEMERSSFVLGCK